MLYNLIKKWRDKETVVMTDQLKKVNARKKQLLQSQRAGIKKQKVEYLVVPADKGEQKYKEKPHNLNLSGQGQAGPPRIKKEK